MSLRVKNIFSANFVGRDEKYKVVKVMRKTGNKKIIRKNLTRSEAISLVAKYPDSQNHMVVFYKQ